ncbi:MAG: alpha/beta hydrolase [Actinomycetota bacterium]|nr:alpha/beta hydrolase [Actinomycetota bacterium]
MPIADLGASQLYYKTHGEGPPVLGIMGFGLDQRFWSSQIAGVVGTHSFITFDNRGVGRSTGEPPQSIDEMAEDTIALLDHLGLEKTVLFGVSMGGAIAQRLVLAHPERVSALILGITWARPLDFMARQAALGRLIIGAGGMDAFVQSTLVRMFTPQFFEVAGETLDRMVAAMFADNAPDPAAPEVLNAQLDAIAKHDTLEQLGDVSCRTLVFGGHMDVMVPGFASEEIAAAIPGAELTMFDTGHGCMVEEMDAVNARIATFLRSLPS